MEEKNNNIINELKEMAPLLAKIEKEDLYSVPENYFISLTESILFYIHLYELKTKPQPFSVSEGYFETLADSILFKIHTSNLKNEVQEELSEIAPILNTINKKNIFSVPDNYFQKFPVPASIERKPGKVVSFGGNIRKWVTYVAAASVLFIIATTSYLYVSIHHRAIEKHLPIEQRIAELNEQEMVNYLKDNDGIISGSLIPTNNDDPQIQHMLQRVSDEEIENYLDDYGDQNEKPIKGI
jgi:hypothetical protein